ncbi:MAG: DinB family protein [Chloroflexota bacterium]
MTTNILEWSRSIFVTTPIRWLNLVDSVPVELLSMPPAPNEWSALKCLQHLVEVEREVFPIRMKALLTGQSFSGFEPDSGDMKEPPTIALASVFDNLRKENLILLDQVTKADLDRQALHAEAGIMVSMATFLHQSAAHDLMHTVQAERALMQPFIKGCGLWQDNYSDHVAKIRS